jgi:hypothetical protein
VPCQKCQRDRDTRPSSHLRSTVHVSYDPPSSPVLPAFSCPLSTGGRQECGLEGQVLPGCINYSYDHVPPARGRGHGLSVSQFQERRRTLRSPPLACSIYRIGGLAGSASAARPGRRFEVAEPARLSCRREGSQPSARDLIRQVGTAEAVYSRAPSINGPTHQTQSAVQHGFHWSRPRSAF